MKQIDLTRIDLNLLVVFDILMQERHVSRSAERLGRTQSAVSHALGRLRDQLDDPLLVRVGGAMQPSPFALQLVEDIRPILRSIGRALSPRESFDPATSQQVFRIALPDFWSTAVAAFLEAAATEAPRVVLAWSGLRETSLLDLADQQLDLVVAPTALGQVEGIRSEDIGALSACSFMRKGHPAIRAWGREAWRSYGHVVVTVGDRMTSPVEAASARGRLPRRVSAYVPSFAAVAPLLARTDLIATLPRKALGDAERRYGLVALPPPLRIPALPHSLFWSARQANDPALRWLRARFAPLLGSA